MASDGLLVEGMGIGILERGALGHEGVGDGLAGGLADAEFDTGRIDTLFVDEVLTGI